MAVLCACLLLAVPLLGPPTALAAGEGIDGGSFNELSKATQEAQTQTQTTKTTTARTSESSSTNSHTVIWLGVGVAIALLCAIGFLIARDARRVAPAGDADLVEARSGHDTAVRMRKRRAKARAARQQRKRNR
jgi:hypothetical protein